MSDGFFPSPAFAEWVTKDSEKFRKYFMNQKNLDDQALARKVLQEIQDGFLTAETREAFAQRCIECACSYAFSEDPTALGNLTLYSMVGIAIALLPKTIAGAKA